MVRPMTCPVCGKAVAPVADAAETVPIPFCSDRCKQIDFCRWNDGRYAIVETLDPVRMAEQMQQSTDAESMIDE